MGSDNLQRQGVAEASIVMGIGMLLSSIFVVQRLYVKAFVRKHLGWDDALLVVGWIFAIATQALMLQSIANGDLGIHLWEMSTERSYSYIYIHYYVLVVVYAVPPIACKLVILLSFLEINDVSTMFRWSTYSIMFVVFGYGTGILISGIFQCMPVQSAWDFGINGTCIDRRAAYKANAILGVITDVMIILLPLPTIIALRISTRTKIGLLVLFLIGSMTVATSIVRLYLLYQMTWSYDETWDGIYVDLWVGVEANLLVMSASLSTLRLFFRAVAPKLLSSSGRSKDTASVVGTNEAIVPFGRTGSESKTPRSRPAQYSHFDNSNGGEYALDTFDIQIEAGTTLPSGNYSEIEKSSRPHT